ncbi:hypothetical protein MMC19_006814 [Ptychographa xylographoides]|nr:hypothetical protein [Ptychographa xylographoides]
MRFLSGGLNNLQLDIVGFLAILGEGAVLANAQVSALSKFVFLPRLLPAPQALIKTSRPDRLAPSDGKVVGCKSGGKQPKLNHVAHILHSGHSLPDYTVRCVRLTKNAQGKPVKARNAGPLTWLSLLGCAMSLVLLGLSIYYGDGMSLVADILLSSLSTIVGIGSKWSLELPQRTSKRKVPAGDVVICYPHGAFHVIKCDENIARELYWAPEKCNYMVGLQAYRFVSLTGTVLLMFGVIALANAQIELQIAWGGAYIILNAAYWVVAALPPRLHWDISLYRVDEERYTGGDRFVNFTQALWQAVAITQETKWARSADVAPDTVAWNEWLRRAGDQVAEFQNEHDDLPKRDLGGNIILPRWDCEGALSALMNPDKVEEFA